MGEGWVDLESVLLAGFQISKFLLDIMLLLLNFVTTMKQHALRSVNKCLNTNIYSYLETSGGQSYNLYLNVVNFFNACPNLTSVAA